MLILWCGGPPRSQVSSKRPSPAVESRLRSGALSVEKSSVSTLLPVRLLWASSAHSCRALVDSGAEGNLLDINLALHLQLPIFPLRNEVMVNALDGQGLPAITHVTGPVTLITSGNHSEVIRFLLINSPLTPVILGHPWLSSTTPVWFGGVTPSPLGAIIVTPLVLCLPVRPCPVLCFRGSRWTCLTCPWSTLT